MINKEENRRTLAAILSVIFVSSFPWFVLFFNNIGTVTIAESKNSLLILTGLGILLLLVLWAIMKNVSKAAVMTAISLLVLSNFALIEKGLTRLIPALYYWHVLVIILFLLYAVGFSIKHQLTDEKAGIISQAILVIFSLLLVVNIIMAVPNINKVLRQSKKENKLIESVNPVQQLSTLETRPNVYYFIFDEYGGYENLLRYCDFDNSKFLNSLEELGFNVSLDSRNKTIDTFTEIPNLLQLEEVNTVDMTDTAKKDNIKNPKLLIDMKKLGYKVNVLQTSGYKFIDELYADFLFDAGKGNTSFRTFDSYLYEQTVYHPFYGGQDQNIEINRMESMFKYAEDAINYGPENNFTIGYFCFPHLPYIVDEHGRKTSSTLRTDLKNPDPYLAQLKYANVKIFDLVSKIIQAQPDAIIILQSDHGFRLPSHLDHWYGIKAYDLEVESIFERNILNAVYYGGEKIDIAELNGLTTINLVLERLTNP